jgi:hypothetical protein
MKTTTLLAIMLSTTLLSSSAVMADQAPIDEYSAVSIFYPAEVMNNASEARVNYSIDPLTEDEKAVALDVELFPDGNR